MEKTARGLVWLGAYVLVAWSPAAALAQAERPTATILTTQRTDVEAGEGAAFDRTLRSRVDALGVVRTEGAVALDLEQIELAIGCMGETVECLSAIASETGTPIIVAPSLARASGTIVATVLVFDGRDQSLRRGTREVPASDASALLGSVDGLLREIFGLPAEASTDTDTAPPPTTTPAAGHALLWTPIVVSTLGGLMLIAGAIAGGLSLADASSYQGAHPATAAEADSALDSVLARQRTEAFVADGMLIAGAVVAIGGLVWVLAAGNEDGSSPLALSPIVSGTQIGLALSGTFGGAL